MSYILYSLSLNRPFARIDADAATAIAGPGELVIPCEADADPDDVERWQAEAAKPPLEPTPEERLAAARAHKKADLDAAFTQAQDHGHLMSSLGFEIDANETANRNISGLIDKMTRRSLAATAFCDYTNTMQSVTLDNLWTMRLEIIDYGEALYVRKWRIRDEIEAAETPEAVKSLSIDFDLSPASPPETAQPSRDVEGAA